MHLGRALCFAFLFFFSVMLPAWNLGHGFNLSQMRKYCSFWWPHHGDSCPNPPPQQSRFNTVIASSLLLEFDVKCRNLGKLRGHGRLWYSRLNSEFTKTNVSSTCLSIWWDWCVWIASSSFPSPFFFNQGNKFQAKYSKVIFNYSLKCNYLSYQPCGFLFAALIWQLVVCNFWKAYTLQESVIFMLLKVEMLN